MLQVAFIAIKMHCQHEIEIETEIEMKTFLEAGNNKLQLLYLGTSTACICGFTIL